MCTRHWLGLSHVTEDSNGEIEPGRAVMARWQVPGQPAFFVVSAYLFTGTGLQQENLGIFEKIGQHAARAGMPAIMAADFNMAPSELALCDFAQKMHAAVVAPEQPTARCGPGKPVGLLRH